MAAEATAVAASMRQAATDGLAEVDAYIGIGSNLGDRRALIAAAAAELAALDGVGWGGLSSLYASPAWQAEAGEYLNAVAHLRTSLGASALLTALQAIERRHGRTRPRPGAPRTLDLDLLLYGREQHGGATLAVPHPRLHERAFVLVPLAELTPQLEIPGRGTVGELLPAVASQLLTRLGPVA